MSEPVLRLLGALSRCATWEEVAARLAPEGVICYWLDQHGRWMGREGLVEDPVVRPSLSTFQGQGAGGFLVSLRDNRLVPLWVRGRLVGALLATPGWFPALADFLALWADAHQVAFTHHARTLLNEICGLSQTAHEGVRLLWEAMPPEEAARAEMAEVVEDLRVVAGAAQQLVDLVEDRAERPIP